MPTSIRDNRIKFYYNFGDYNNSFKALSQTQTSNIPLVLSKINKEHPIECRQEL